MGRIVEAGRLDAASLFAAFDFTRDQLNQAATRWAEDVGTGLPAPKPRELRTYVHELQHYHSYTTTPAGLFLQYCRILQNHATIGIVKELLDAGLPVCQPLLYKLPNMPPRVSQVVGAWLGMWLNVEHVVTTFNGDTAGRLALHEWWINDEARLEAGLRALRPSLLGLSEAFPTVQQAMAEFIQFRNAAASAEGSPLPMYATNISMDAINQARTQPPSDHDRAIERTEMGMAGLGAPDSFAVSALIESAASAAEWWDTGVAYDDFRAWTFADVDSSLHVYRTCIAQALKVIGTRDLERFLLSYLTMCELALYGPVLPHHAHLRAHESFEELLPNIRFTMLLRAADRVAPMLERADHARYVDELIDDLGWIHPGEILASAEQGPTVVTDPLTTVYLQAQFLRAHGDRSAFVGFDRLLFEQSPAGNQWRQLFDFVIVDYQDKTTYHPDKGFLESMTTRYLNMQGLQAVMLGRGLTLSAPYAKHDELEKEWMTGWLRKRFRTLFDRDFRAVRYV